MYALASPGFSGTLPPNVIPVAMPLNAMTLIFRADRSSSNGDQTDQANAFRAQFQLQTLCQYLSNPSGGATARGNSSLRYTKSMLPMSRAGGAHGI